MLQEHFGESVVYLPRGGGRRTIKAIIRRSPPAIFDAAGNVVLPGFIVRVADDCQRGIRGSEVDTGGDRIELQKRDGDTVTIVASVMQLMSQDSGVTVLALT